MGKLWLVTAYPLCDGNTSWFYLRRSVYKNGTTSHFPAKRTIPTIKTFTPYSLQLRNYSYLKRIIKLDNKNNPLITSRIHPSTKYKMTLARNHTDNEMEEKPQQPLIESRDSMSCQYIFEYRVRQHHREFQRHLRSPSHKMHCAMARILHGPKLITTKLAGLSQRIREAYKLHRPDVVPGIVPNVVHQVSELPCECGSCLQQERLASFYRDFEGRSLVWGVWAAMVEYVEGKNLGRRGEDVGWYW